MVNTQPASQVCLQQCAVLLWYNKGQTLASTGHKSAGKSSLVKCRGGQKALCSMWNSLVYLILVQHLAVEHKGQSHSLT